MIKNERINFTSFTYGEYFQDSIGQWHYMLLRKWYEGDDVVGIAGSDLVDTVATKEKAIKRLHELFEQYKNSRPPVYRLKNQLEALIEEQAPYDKRQSKMYEIGEVYEIFADGGAAIHIYLDSPVMTIETYDREGAKGHAGYLGNVFEDTEEVKARINAHLGRNGGTVNALNH